VATTRGVDWSWSGALRGAAYAAPAAVVAVGDVSAGLALAVGVVPAAVLAVAPTRRDRWVTAVVGALAGVSILVGSVVAHVPVVAVATVFGLAVGVIAVARRRPRVGAALMGLALPLVGVGLSYRDLDEAATIAGLMVAGSVYAALVSLAWPERAPSPPPTSAAARPPLVYGVQLGLAGATAAAIGFALDFDHVGWATAACLLVMRPSADLQRLRSNGRIISVIVGAACAGVLAHTTDAPAAYSVAVVVALALAAATRASRWYVTATFTTFLALSLLVYSDPDSAGARFNERVVETLLGVGLALLFGPVLGRVLAARRAQDSSTGRPAT